MAGPFDSASCNSNPEDLIKYLSKTHWQFPSGRSFWLVPPELTWLFNVLSRATIASHEYSEWSEVFCSHYFRCLIKNTAENVGNFLNVIFSLHWILCGHQYTTRHIQNLANGGLGGPTDRLTKRVEKQHSILKRWLCKARFWICEYELTFYKSTKAVQEMSIFAVLFLHK